MASSPVLVARYASASELEEVLRAALSMEIIYVKLSVPPPPGKHTLQLWVGSGLVAAVIAEIVGSGRSGEYPLRLRPLDPTHVPELQSLLERATFAPPVALARKSSMRAAEVAPDPPPVRRGSSPEIEAPSPAIMPRIPSRPPEEPAPMRPRMSSRPPEEPMRPRAPSRPSELPSEPPPAIRPRLPSRPPVEPAATRPGSDATQPSRSPRVSASDSAALAPRQSRSPRVMASDSNPPAPLPSRSPRALADGASADDKTLASRSNSPAPPAAAQKTMEVDAPPPLPKTPPPPAPPRPSEAEIVPGTVVFNPEAVMRDPTITTGSEDETLPRSAGHRSGSVRPVKDRGMNEFVTDDSPTPTPTNQSFIEQKTVSWNIRIAPTTKDPLCGRIIAAGKYVLESVIGTGAIGIVFKASHRDLGRTVAIKVLNPQFRDDPDLLRVIRSEARAASLLEHPNVARVYDYGHEPDGLVYIVMEYLSGYTLGNVLGARRKVAFPRTVDVMLQVCGALSAAHERGIVHRDVKPDNVVLVPAQDDEGQPTEIVKVCDFGIAALGTRRRVGSDIVETPAGESYAAGTPEYMAPEQATGGPVTAAVDVYACGVVLYEMLTGVVPFSCGPGEMPYQIFVKHREEAPRPPSELTPGVPATLETIVLRALEKQAERRYPSARDMRLELRKAL